MAKVISYEQWMADTYSLVRPRSKELVAIDSALRAFHLAEKNSSGSILGERRALQQALETWKAAQKAKGQDWRKSVRNKNHIVEKLSDALGAVIVGAGGLNSRGETMIDPAELQALKLVSDAIKQNTRTMFTGAKLTSKMFKQLADLGTVKTAMSDFKTAVSAIKSPPPSVDLNAKLQALLASLFGETVANEAKAALGPVFADFLSSAAPFVGACKSGASAVVGWCKVAKGFYDKSEMSDARGSFAAGDPAAAFDAILLIMNRDIKQWATTAGIYTVGTVVKASGAALDLGAATGPATAAAEKLALVIQQIYLFARDWNEMKAANAALDTGPYDFSLFKANPLLGCYLIANSDTSAIINMAVADYGRPGWKLEVEMMVNKAKPVFEKSRSVIADSRYEIASMSRAKGVVIDRNEKVMGVAVGKLNGVIADISAAISKSASGGGS